MARRAGRQFGAMTKHALLALCLVACGGGGDGGAGDNMQNPDAGVDPGPRWELADVTGVPNLDDDDGTGIDWMQAPFASDNDYAALVVPAAQQTLVPPGGSIVLAFDNTAANVRVFQDGVLLLGGTAGAGPARITPTGADITLQVAFGDYAATATLAVRAVDGTGVAAHATTVTLRGAPLLLNHHLQDAERVWAVRVTGNDAFHDAFETALGGAFTSLSGDSYDSDVWMQDEIEFATMTAANGGRIDVVIDSIRNRGLDPFAETLVAPDVMSATWGDPDLRTTYDSFGNLEASPPVEVNGVKYPFGRIYYGRTGDRGLSAELGAFLASQKLQAPIELPTRWLCVGHVDEYMTFVPDASSPKGFKLVIADVPAAYDVLESLSPTASIGRYGADHGYSTVGSMVNDTALRALNDDLQLTYLDPILATLKAELGLTDADVIKIPALFETVSGCNGRVAALLPGMVNLVVAKVAGTTHLFTADPFFRASGAAQSADPVIAAFSAAMPAGIELHFVDDWDVYHMGLGEVHCGSNVKRAPAGAWWPGAN